VSLALGTRLGPYEVTAQIGVGGMGEVYRATDTNLARQVAIKVLPEAVAADAERLARFDREAKTLAALNHPNIAAIYGLEKSGGTTALVMELVEGPTLADRIGKGPIPIGEALPIAKQMAEALEAAHEQGIIHRDLKPANIKVRSDGTVKVLDFGIAKVVPAGSSAAHTSEAPTITTPAMTEAGLILGTAAYMSPEQAAGIPVDRRADIWAYGVILWEMLSGQRLFGGDRVVHTLADVLRRSIEFDKLDIPTPINILLRRCLDRDVKMRLRDIGEARVAIATYLIDPTTGTDVPRRPRPVYRWAAWAAAGSERRNDRGCGDDDRATGRKHHARRRPACNPRDLARRLGSDLL
jgi:serine/threonine protein kinase